MHARLLLTGAVLALVGCYRAPSFDQPCSITCTSECPGALTCDPTLHVCVGPEDDCHDVIPTTPVELASVTAGTGVACGLDTEKHLWCWGSNVDHVIDPGSTVQYPEPHQVGTKIWDSITLHASHACGLADAGHLYCWGRNDVYQAIGREADASMPQEITVGVSHWSMVALGVRSTCAIGDNRLFCWGYNKLGSLGTGEISDARMPIHETNNTRSDWTTVAVGSSHTCAIAGNDLFCFGHADYGKTGDIGGGNPGTITTPISSDLWKSLALSDSATCATKLDGTLWCFGAGGSGELGPGTTTNSAIPAVLDGGSTGWSKIVASYQQFCGLQNGTVRCWGQAAIGGLPKGWWANVDHQFVDVPNHAPGTATDVALGWSYDYVPTLDASPRSDRAPGYELGCLLSGTTASCWGDARSGALGDGGSTMTPIPTEIAGAAFDQIALGASHGCGVANGSIACWGSTLAGQASGAIAGTKASPCVAGTCDRATPTTIANITNATTIATGLEHTCALHDGKVSCWGNNTDGQLGGGDTGGPASKRDVAGTFVELLQTGGDRQCARKTDGVYCWGLELDSQPVRLPAYDAFVAIASGATFRCFLDANHLMSCEGDNSDGQFGQVGPGSSDTPVPARIGPAYTAIAASAADHACGLRLDGDVECWGANSRGQVGTTPSPSETTPNTLTAIHQCTSIATTATIAPAEDSSLGSPQPYVASCALCEGSPGGNAYCWGDNRYGELGIGTTDLTTHPVPERVALPDRPGDPYVALVAGGGFTCATTMQKHVLCWGMSVHGGMGHGVPANLPVAVDAKRPL